MALGVTMYLPGERPLSANERISAWPDRDARWADALPKRCLSARVTTGASNDIEKATEIARAMVCEYGMSDLGPLTFGKKEEQIFLGREISQHRDYSEDTAIKIDKEVKKIVAEQYAAGEEDPRGQPRRDGSALPRHLLEFETLDSVQIRRVIAGLPLDGDDARLRPPDDDGTPGIRREGEEPLQETDPAADNAEQSGNGIGFFSFRRI